MFALVKRVGEKDENLASSFYAMLLSTNMIAFFFPLKFLIPKGSLTPFPYNVLTIMIFISIFFFWNFVCNYYFLKKGNYSRIIENYEGKFPNKKKQLALIGVSYFILTPLIFISMAICLSKITWHF